MGVTGHRDLAADQVPAIEQAIHLILEDIQRRARHSPLLILSSLAEGADRLVVNVAVARFGVAYAAVLPRPAEDYRRDFQSPESVAEFDRLLAGARYVTNQGSPVPVDPSDTATMNNAYLRAGAWVSLHSHVLIALWDSQPARGRGGTADIVDLRKKGRYPGLNDADPLQYAENGTTACLVVARSGEKVTHNASILRHEWWYADVERRYAESPLAHFHSSLASIDCVNRLANGYRAQLARPDFDSMSARLLVAADGLANRFQRRVYWSAFALVVATLVALISAVSGDWITPAAINVLKYGSLAIGGVAWGCLRFSMWPNHFADFRALAEAMRVQVAWASAGISNGVADVYHPVQAMEVSWIRRVARTAACLDNISASREGRSTGVASVTDAAARDWIVGQINYFTGRKGVVEKYRRRRKVLWFLGVACIAAVFLILGHGRVPELVSSLSNEEWSSKTAFFAILASVAGSALAAGTALVAYQSVVAIRELENSYATMAHLYAIAEESIRKTTESTKVNDATNYVRLLEAIGKAALVENTWWLLLRRQRQRQPRPPSLH